MSDEKPGKPGPQSGTPAAKAKSNGTTPTVTARRPISKAEYARTTKATPDATSVIPAVRDDQPPPEDLTKDAAAKGTGPETDDRPTQMMKAVPAQDAPDAKPVAPAKPEPKTKSEPKAPPKSAKADTAAAAAVGAAAGTGGAAAKAAPAPTPAAPAPTPAAPVPAPATAQPEAKTAPVRPVGPELKRPSEAKQAEKKPAPEAKPEQETKTAPAAESTRSARLKLSHVEPWSVTKMAFVVAVALMVVSVVAVTVFWVVLQMTGVWGALNDSVSNVLADDAAAFDVTDYLGFGRVVGLTLLVSSLNVIFMTALATIAAHLYNLAAGILGGIELTFGERK